MEHPQSNQEQNRISEFADIVISTIEVLSTTGKSYRKKIYKLNDITKYFVENMKIKNASLGAKYIDNMVINIETIIKNVSRQSKYDVLEFIYSIIKYGFKMISYKYTKTKIEPTLPDYTLAEIQDAVQDLVNPARKL
jgi:hypothetical protein